MISLLCPPGCGLLSRAKRTRLVLVAAFVLAALLSTGLAVTQPGSADAQDSVVVSAKMSGTATGQVRWGTVAVEFASELDPNSAAVWQGSLFTLTSRHTGADTDNASLTGLNARVSSSDSKVLLVDFSTHTSPGRNGTLFLGTHPTTHTAHDYKITYAANNGKRRLRFADGTGVPSFNPVDVTRDAFTATWTAPDTWDNDNPSPLTATLTLSESLLSNFFEHLVTATNATLSYPKSNAAKTQFTYTVYPTGDSDGNLNGDVVLTAAVPTAQQCANSVRGRLCSVDRRPLSAGVTATIAASNAASTAKVIESVKMEGRATGSAPHNWNMWGTVSIEFGTALADPNQTLKKAGGFFTLTRKYAGETNSRGTITALNPRLDSDNNKILLLDFSTHSGRGSNSSLFMGNHPTTHEAYDYEISYTYPSGHWRLANADEWWVPSFDGVAVDRDPLTVTGFSTDATGWTKGERFTVTLDLSTPVLADFFQNGVTLTNSKLRFPRANAAKTRITYTVEPTAPNSTTRTIVLNTVIPTAQQCATSSSDDGYLCTVDRRPLTGTSLSVTIPRATGGL